MPTPLAEVGHQLELLDRPFPAALGSSVNVRGVIMQESPFLGNNYGREAFSRQVSGSRWSGGSGEALHSGPLLLDQGLAPVLKLLAASSKARST